MNCSNLVQSTVYHLFDPNNSCAFQMVGVGTANVNLSGSRHAFTSLLGRDAESWGLSYYGRIQHKGHFEEIRGGKFGQGTILGVHVDMWHGTVSYYKNRRPLGNVQG